MLENVEVVNNDPIQRLIAEANSNDPDIRRHRQGVYEIGSFNFEYMMVGFKDSFETRHPSIEGTDFYNVGVCDNYQQVLDKWPIIETETRKFVMSITPIVKANQPPQGGWRWHKWGDYIGVHQPQCEYLYDEPQIDKVYVYHIYEII